MRWGFALLVIAIAVAVIYVVSTFAIRQVVSDATQTPCPSLPDRIRPTDFHFSPGLVEHVSWVDFPVPRSFAGWYAFCLDGTQLQTGSGVLDFHTGTARFSVSTTWVNLHWLGGNLDGLRDPDRWELRLMCAPDWRCE
jgi:hypothetical protein